MTAETQARWEAILRPLLVALPAPLAVRLYSSGRRRFLERLLRERPAAYEPPAELSRTLWGLSFRSPLGNAAGMFKNGRGYELAARQGAGYFLAGTTTARARPGNRRSGVGQPFAPYPRSGAASNWLGLPNDGHEAVAERLAGIERVAGCPLGASLAGCPGLGGSDGEEERLAGLVRGLELYEAAGVDFVEINESCPNTEEASPRGSDLYRRLERLAEGFLAQRRRPLPVVVKFSVDTELEQVPELVDALVELGYDGVDFGNTSTAYDACLPAIAGAERRLYRHFTRRFGGGVSGRPLAGPSLALVRCAAEHLAHRPPGRELHLVRTGGVASPWDVRESLEAGADLCGWYTGYFEVFARQGHEVYRTLFETLREDRQG